LIKAGISTARLVTSPQALNECYRVLTDRRKLLAQLPARAFVASLLTTCRAPLTRQTILVAWEVQDATNFGWWDCLLLASAIQAGCTHFLTEDLSDGQTLRGLTIVNPFTTDISPLLN